MKLRKIILITGVFLVYISYIVRFVLLCKFNKKLIIVDDNATGWDKTFITDNR